MDWEAELSVDTVKIGSYSTESSKTQAKYKTIALQATKETEHII